MRSDTELALGAFLPDMPDMGAMCDADPYDKASSWGALRLLAKAAAVLAVAIALCAAGGGG